MKAAQLKASILQEAVQGRLVPQNADDESASILLERIREEKSRLVAEGVIRADRNASRIYREDGHFYEAVGTVAPVCIDDELPFEIPESWEWCRLTSLVFLTSGNQYDEIDHGVPYLKVADMNLEVNLNEIITSSRFTSSGNKGIIPCYSIIFPKRGGAIATNKKRIVIKAPVYVDSNIMGMSVILIDMFQFIKMWFDSIDLGKLQSGTSVPQINNKDLEPLLIPLPPLAEQRRIVAKLDELLPLVEEYGKLESGLSEIDAAFPAALKKSVLQEAVQGRLVPQNADDESASILLERIREEKSRLVAEGVIRADRNASRIYREDGHFYEAVGTAAPVCIDDELPFEIPESWEWARFGSVITLQSGQDMTPDNYNSNGQGIPYITGASNIENGEVIINRWTESGRAFAYRNDILLTCKGTVGTIAILKNDVVHIARQIMAVRPSDEIFLEYVLIVLNTSVERLKSAARSMIPGISRDDVLFSFFPLPPLAEQRRIVAKVEELLSLIDECKEIHI